MPETTSSGVTLADVQALLAALPSGFVNNGVEMTVAQLLTNYPADASMVYKYARVSDLYGSARSVMICESSNGQFYWRPQRTDFSSSTGATNGTVTLTPLLTPPTLVFTGTLTGNVTATPSSTNVWPGASFTVIANGVLGLFGINLSGLANAGTVPLLGGSIRTVTYVSGTGWRAG